MESNGKRNGTDFSKKKIQLETLSRRNSNQFEISSGNAIEIIEQQL